MKNSLSAVLRFILMAHPNRQGPGLIAALELTRSEQGPTPLAGLVCIGTLIGNGSDMLVERAHSWANQSEEDVALPRTTWLRFDEHYAGAVAAGW